MDDFLRRLAPRPSDYGGLPGKITREDDAGNVYDESGRKIFNKFDQTEQPDSWLDTAISTATAPAKLATGLVGSLNPYGQDGWQVPPIISEPAAAFARSGELTGFGEDGRFYLPNVQNPQAAADVGMQLMTLYGGNALNPLARVPKGAIASGAVKQEPFKARGYHGSDRGFERFREPDGGGLYSDLDVPHEGVWSASEPARAEWFANNAHRMNMGDPQSTGPAIYPVDVEFRNPYLHPAEMYADEGISSIPSEFELKSLGHDGAVVNRARWEYVDDKLTLIPEGQDFQALQPGTVRSATTGEILFSDNKPSLMGSALASRASLPMDQASRLQRAAEQGYDTSNVLYRGMDTAPEDGQYRSAPGSLGDGVYLTPDPSHAAKFGDDVRENFIRGNVATANDVPPEVYRRGLLTDLLGLEGTQSSRMAEWARANGYAGFSQPGYQTVVFDPSNIRSVNAAFDPSRAGENGLLLSDNKPSLLGSALASGQGEARGITAYHGSPHDFDKFSMDKIGTGTGFAWDGYGLNFSDSRQTAEAYRDMTNGAYLYQAELPRGPYLDYELPLNQHPPEVQAAINDLLSSQSASPDFAAISDPNLPAGNHYGAIAWNGKLDHRMLNEELSKRGVVGRVVDNPDQPGSRNYTLFQEPTIAHKWHGGEQLYSDNRPSLIGSALASGQGEEDILSLLGYR